MNAALISGLFQRPQFGDSQSAPAQLQTSVHWSEFNTADKLRLYVLSWLQAEQKFAAVANDPAAGKVPNFLCMRLEDAKLMVLPGNQYAEQIELYLLIGEHVIDQTSLYQRAVGQIFAKLALEQQTLFDVNEPVLHEQIHITEHQLLYRDAEIFWLHNVNYPGLLMLLLNSFYRFSREHVDTLLIEQLSLLANEHESVLNRAMEEVNPWLYSK